MSQDELTRLATILASTIHAVSNPFVPDAKPGDFAGMVDIAKHNELLARSRAWWVEKARELDRLGVNLA